MKSVSRFWMICLLLGCFSASGQGFTFKDLPFLADQVSTNCNFTGSFPVASATLYAEFFADSPTNWTGNMAGGGVAGTNGWLNELNNGDLLLATNQLLGATICPSYAHTGPNGYWNLVFTNNNNPGGQTLFSCLRGTQTPVTWSNQPNTIFMVATDDADESGSGQTLGCTLFDCLSGSREMWRIGPSTTGQMYSGTVLTVAASANTKKWMIYSMVFNGSNSYVRTNGVLYAAGNVGGNAMGQMMLAQDLAQQTPYFGKIYALLIYKGAMNTNDLKTIEINLNCKANLGYTMPP